jgi:uncharacterized membrane protein
VNDPLFLVSILAANVLVAELLARYTPLRHLGTALLVIVTTAVCANVGLIPTVTAGSPVYDAIFDPVAYLAIFLLLLRVNLRDVLKAGGAMIALFLLGAVGTVLGVVAGMSVLGGPERFGELYRALGGMFVGTYVGGSLNFNAIALEYGVTERPVLLAGANAVDAGMSTVWMALGIVAPRLLRVLFGRARPARTASAGVDPGGIGVDTEPVHALDLAWCVALSALGLVASRWSAAWLSARLGWNVPMILVLTTLALALAQAPAVKRLVGARLLGMFGVYLFLAVIGALCDLAALRETGSVGWSIFLFVCVVLLVHGLVVFGAAALLGLDFDAASVASQANVGGGTTALALARSLGRPDLVLPAILIGSLGTALGTFLGIFTLERLL